MKLGFLSFFFSIAWAQAAFSPPVGGLMLHVVTGAKYCRSEISLRENETLLWVSSDCVCTGAAGTWEEIRWTGDRFGRSESLSAVVFEVEFFEDQNFQAICSNGRVTGVWESEN